MGRKKMNDEEKKDSLERRKAYMKIYRKTYYKTYYKNNNERLRGKKRAYYENSKDKRKSEKKDYYENNKNKILISHRRNNKVSCENLVDSYIKIILKRKGILECQITQTLIQAKRSQMKLSRSLRAIKSVCS